MTRPIFAAAMPGAFRPSLLAAVSALALSAGIATQAAAQQVYTSQPRQAQTSYERTPQDFAPLGITMGSFLLSPKVEATQAYNDNIYKTQTNANEDFITTISPSLELTSDWSNHEVSFLAEGDLVRYWDKDSENHENYNLAGDFRLDLLRDVNFYGGASYRMAHEERGSPDGAGGTEPTEYHVATGSLGYFHRFNRLSLRADGEVSEYDYNDVPNSTGGVTDQDARDRTKTQGTLRVGYEFFEGWEPFVRGRVVQNEYRLSTDGGGFRRDSNGYDMVVGTAMNLSRLVIGEIFAGYSHREFDDSRFNDMDKPTYGASLVWNVTPLTTLIGSLNRTIDETTQANSPASLATTYGVTMDTELRRDLVLEAAVSMTDTEYEQITREDRLIKIGTRARYYLSRNVYVGPDIEYSTRDVENAANSDYDNWVFLFRIGGQI